MAIQLLPGSDFGGDIGKSLGTGLGSGLKQLAKMQLDQLQKRRGLETLMSGLEGVVSPEQAQRLAPLARQNPQVFGQLLKTLTDQPREALKEQRESRKEQREINKDYAPLIKETKSHAKSSKGLQANANEVLKHIEENSGKLAVGPIIGHTPIIDSKTRKLDALLKKLVLKLAAKDRIPGLRGQFYLKMVEDAKASRLFSEPDLVKFVQEIGNEASEDMGTNKALFDIIKENDGKIPEDLEFQLYNKLEGAEGQIAQGQEQGLAPQAVQPQAQDAIAQSRQPQQPSPLEQIANQAQSPQQQPQPQQPQQQDEPRAQQFLTSTDPRFLSKLPKVERELNKIQTIAKNLAKVPGFVAEEGFGLPSAIADLGRQAANIGGFIATGKDAILGKEKLPLGPKWIRDNVTAPAYEAATGKKNFLEPKTKAEEKFADIVQTAVPLMMSGNLTGLGKRALKALGISGAASVADWAGERVGGPAVGKIAKMGTLTGLSLMNFKSPRSYASKLFGKSDKIPNTTLVTGKPINNAMKSIDKKLAGGLGRDRGISEKVAKLLGTEKKTVVPSKQFMNDLMDDVSTLETKAGTFKIKDLFKVSKNISEKYGRGEVPSNARPLVRELFDSFKEAYKTAPKSVQPLIESKLLADDIWKSTAVFKQIKDSFKPKNFLGLGIGGNLLIKLFGSKALAGVAAAGVGTKIARTLVKSKGMRSYMGNMLKALANNKTAAAVRYAQKVAEEAGIDKEDLK